MTTTAPGQQAVKPQQVKPRRVSRVAHGATAHDDDPTVYPSYEPVGREPVESDIAEAFEPVVRRLLTERGIVCYVGSDNFIYWIKGNNKASVSPDVYVLPGMSPNARPRQFAGSKDEGCWKTWIHRAVPSFALEVKARRNPRKDELQSPDRHDGLGTKELVVFDPFAHRRRTPRKRFVVYRRNESGKLISVLETNDDRVYSQELEAFIVVDGDDEDTCLLRLGLGSNGERLLPFEWELVHRETQRANKEARRADDEAQRADHEAQRAEQEARMRQEETQRAEQEARMRQEEARMRQEEARRAEQEARMRQEEARRADEAMRLAQETARRNAELEAEIARLRADVGKRRKR